MPEPPASDRPDDAPSKQSRRRRWSRRDAAVRIVEILSDAGHTAYFAGGCVRDEYMGRKPADYDIATSAKPDEVQSIFNRTKAVGEHFGVVLVEIKRFRIEVATFRTEWGYTDNRRPDHVTFSDAEHDARRRDFTINGLFKDPLSDEIIDYIDGRDDIDAGIIRAIDDPDKRLSEDHLRALRAVRFAARFEFEIEPSTAAAISQHAAELRGVSRERIGHEMRAMLTDPHRATAVELIQQLGLDGPLLQEDQQVTALDTLRQLPADADYPTALAAWLLDRSDDPTSAAKRCHRSLMLSNSVWNDLKRILADFQQVDSGQWLTATVAVQKRVAATAQFQRVLIVMRARKPQLAEEVAKRVYELGQLHGGLSPRPFLSGEDLIDMGLEPGPVFKRIIDSVYDAQLEGRINSNLEARHLAENLAKDTDHLH